MLIRGILVVLLLISNASKAAENPEPTTDIWASRNLEDFRNYSPKVVPTQAPIYPVRLMRKRIGGLVYVIYSYNTNGEIISARIGRTSGNKDLDNAALIAIKAWRVIPIIVNGLPVAGEGAQPFNFTPP